MSYYTRFKELVDQIEEDLTDQKIINCFKNGVSNANLDYELQIRRTIRRKELYEWAYDVVIAEERRTKRDGNTYEEVVRIDKERVQDRLGEREDHRRKNKKRSTKRVSEVFTPLTVSRAEIMNAIDLGWRKFIVVVRKAVNISKLLITVFIFSSLLSLFW